MLRAAILPRDPQDETTANSEDHLYGTHRSKLKASNPWDLALSRIATGFVIETGSGPRPG